jgi:RNA polymerase sigma-70 factor (ECF subfamily)
MAEDARPDDFESGLRPLWLRAQAGDEAAYRAALTLIAARLRAYFRRRLQNLPDDLEDLVQETLLALHLQRGTHDAAVPVSAWMFAIARHKLIDLWRRRGRHAELHTSLDDLDEDQLPGRDDSAAPARRDLLLLLESLPTAQRDAIVLTKVEGLSVAEAAERTGASISALKVQVHRGLKKLADLIRSDAA